MEKETEGFIEQEPSRVYAKITLLRHGETKDPRSEGLKEGAEERIKNIVSNLQERIRENEELFLVNSPSLRAQETAKVVSDTLGVNSENERDVKLLQTMLLRDKDKAWSIIDKYFDPDDPQRKRLTRAFVDPATEGLDDPNVIETRTELKERTATAVKLALRFFENFRKKRQQGERTPHLLAVTHTELLTPLVHDLFEIDYDTLGGVDYSEPIEITIFESPHADTLSKMRAQITFRGETKDIIIDSKDGTIKEAETA